MIRGYFDDDGFPHRPFVKGRIELPSLRIAGEIDFLIDTGTDATTLAPLDVMFLRIDTRELPGGPWTIGVGGRTATARVDARLSFGDRALPIGLRVLAPRSRRQQQAVLGLPSLLGRDVLRHFALVIEERTDRVLLLNHEEAAALPLP